MGETGPYHKTDIYIPSISLMELYEREAWEYIKTRRLSERLQSATI